MHILTGMVVAGLLGRRKKTARSPAAPVRRSPLLRAPGVLAVRHALPGRTRFHVPSLKGNLAAADRLEQTLSGIEGIRVVQANALTGNVLIEHEAERIAPDVLAAALVRLLGLEGELTRSLEARLSRELREISRAVNRAMYDSTAGWLDLRTVLLLVLAAVGLRKVLQQRALALPAGFTLLWWAGNGLLRGSETAS